jgi:hypothetical protein
VNAKIRVESISNDRARELWHESPQATAFTHPDILEHCAQKVDWWGAWRSEDLVAVWPVCRSYKNLKPFKPTFLYYVGPLFSREIHGFKYHRYQAIRQQALEAFLPFLVERYDHLQFAMPPGETDVRAFEWWNQENSGSAKFNFKPRHTARIYAIDRSTDELYGDFARNRKRDLRLNGHIQPVRSESWELNELIELHNEPMHRQRIAIPEERISALCRVVSVASQGYGAVQAWRDPRNGQLASFIVLLYGRDEANDILCVASNEWRDRGLAAWTTWNGLLQARSEDKRIFDFNGANSPRRAADKHAFGARAELYFAVTMDRSKDGAA